MSRPSFREHVYAPLRDKTLRNVLCHLFVTQFGYGDKAIFAEAIVERVLSTLEQYLYPVQSLKPGQMLWLAVAHDGHKHANQAMREIPLVPVVLDLVTDDELQALAQGQPYLQTRRQRVVRLLHQAIEQGGVLAETDLSALLLASVSRLSDDIRRLQREGQNLPYRGTVQDVGPTLTHKAQIIRLYEQGHLETDICRLLSPTHSLDAVTRYIETYKKVTRLLERGFSAPEIGGILRLSTRLVHVYAAIIQQYHPDVLARNPHFTKGDALPI
jgi:hypothetical protein